MCLLLVALKADERFPLVLAANRDEFYGRPAAPAAWWDENPEILAGRDLQAGGTWLGLTRGGRVAALTNFRQPAMPRPDARSRGALVAEFLASAASAAEFAERLSAEAELYNGFNLFFGDLDGGFYFFSNRTSRPPEPIAPGFHGLSNHLLDTPWPKVERGRRGLRTWLDSAEDPDPEELLALLSDRTQPPDAELPDTGVGLELERVLAPMFLHTPMYGTRCSTVLIVDFQRQARFIERSFGPEATWLGSRSYELRLAARRAGAPAG